MPSSRIIWLEVTQVSSFVTGITVGSTRETTATVFGLKCRIAGCRRGEHCAISHDPQELQDWVHLWRDRTLKIHFQCPTCHKSVRFFRSLAEYRQQQENLGCFPDAKYFAYPITIAPADLYASDLIYRYDESLLVELATAMIRDGILTSTRDIARDPLKLIGSVFFASDEEMDRPAVTLHELDEEKDCVNAVIFHGFPLAGILELFEFERGSGRLHLKSRRIVGVS